MEMITRNQGQQQHETRTIMKSAVKVKLVPLSNTILYLVIDRFKTTVHSIQRSLQTEHVSGSAEVVAANRLTLLEAYTT